MSDEWIPTTKDFRAWCDERCFHLGLDPMPETMALAFKTGNPLDLHVGIISEWHDYVKNERISRDSASLREKRLLVLGVDASRVSKFAALIIERALEAQSRQDCYIYLKMWDVGGGKTWYKVGITNDLSRRDREQNVLPVPAATLLAIKVASEQSAKAIERSIHDSLSQFRVLGAQNKELFELESSVLTDLISAMKVLGQQVDLA